MTHRLIARRAHELRRQEMSRLLDAGWQWLGTLLRTRHEQALRRPACPAAVAPANATPA